MYYQKLKIGSLTRQLITLNKSFTSFETPFDLLLKTSHSVSYLFIWCEVLSKYCVNTRDGYPFFFCYHFIFWVQIKYEYGIYNCDTCIHHFLL